MSLLHGVAIQPNVLFQGIDNDNILLHTEQHSALPIYADI